MGDATIITSSWRLVEVGRVVLVQGGVHDGKLAAIVEIIDHKRVCSDWFWVSIPNVRLTREQVLIDGPASDKKTAVPRTALALQNCILTPLVLDKLPRGARTGAIKSAWEKSGIEAKWNESAWAKKREQKERRRALTDFERFKVMRLRKSARFEVRKSLAKVKAAAK